MLVQDTQIIEYGHGTLNSLMISLAWLTLSNVLLVSRTETNTLPLRCVKQLAVCCIVKTASTSEVVLKLNCKGRLCKIH